MHIQPIQFLLIVFLVFAISRVYLRAKEGSLSIWEGLFWLGLFSLATFGVLEPDFTTFMAAQMGIGRGADVVVYMSIVLLFYLIFRIHVMLENLRHEISKLVREIALLEEKQTKSKKKQP